LSATFLFLRKPRFRVLPREMKFVSDYLRPKSFAIFRMWNLPAACARMSQGHCAAMFVLIESARKRKITVDGIVAISPVC